MLSEPIAYDKASTMRIMLSGTRLLINTSNSAQITITKELLGCLLFVSATSELVGCCTVLYMS